MTESEQAVPATRIVRGLVVAQALVLGASVCGQISRFFLGHAELKGMVPLLYVDYERNIPTFFSMCLLLIASMLLAIVTRQVKLHGGPHVAKWATLCFGMLFMAYDEAFQVHEELTTPVRKFLGGDEYGIFYFAWVIPGLLVVALLGLYFLRFLRDLPPTTRKRFLLAGALFVGGACFVDIAGGLYAENFGTRHWNYSLLATLEEGMEMGGVIVFIRGILLYAKETFQGVLLRF